MMSSAHTKPAIPASEASDAILSAMRALQEEFVCKTNESMQCYQRQLEDLVRDRLTQMQVVDARISEPPISDQHIVVTEHPIKEETNEGCLHSQASKEDSQHLTRRTTREYISKDKKARRASQAHLSISQMFVRSPRFEAVVATLILMSVLFLGFKAEVRQETHWIFAVLEISFCSIFSLELCVRLTVDWHRFWSDDTMWNIFDVCTVVASIVDIGLTYLLPASNPPNLMVLRCIRCLRVLRLARVLKQPMFRELRLMIYSILCCAKPFMWAVVLLCIVIYVFAIIFTYAARDALQAVNLDDKDKDELLQKFGLLTRSMYSLLAAILGGADWGEYGRLIGKAHEVYKSVFVFYVIFAQLALLNVVTGIFLDSSLRAATSDKQMMIQEEMMREGLNKVEFEKLFYEASDDEEHLSVDQLTEYLSDVSVKTYLRILDVIYDDPQDLVEMIDKTEKGSVDADEFVKGCIAYKSMQVTDLTAHLKENRRLLVEVHHASSASLQSSTGHRRNNSQGKRGRRSHENSEIPQDAKTGCQIGVDMRDDNPDESQMGFSSGISQEDDAESVWKVRNLEIKTKSASLP